MISPATAQQMGLDVGRLRDAAACRPRGEGGRLYRSWSRRQLRDGSPRLRRAHAAARSAPALASTRISCATSAAPWMALGLKIAKTGETLRFRVGAASVQHRFRGPSREIPPILQAIPPSAATWCRSARSMISARIRPSRRTNRTRSTITGRRFIPTSSTTAMPGACRSI